MLSVRSVRGVSSKAIFLAGCQSEMCLLVHVHHGVPPNNEPVFP